MAAGVNDQDQYLATAAAFIHSCAVRNNDQGQVVCWGSQDDGRSTPSAGLLVRKAPDTLWLSEKTESVEDVIRLEEDPVINLYTTQDVLPEGDDAAILLQATTLISPRLISVKPVFGEHPLPVVLSSTQIELHADRPDALITVSVPDLSLIHI